MILIEAQYFPSIAWFFVARKNQQISIDYAENYTKRSLRNKCIIRQNDVIQALSVPLLKGKHSKKNIAEVLISEGEPWRLNHKKTCATFFGKSPYYIHYALWVEQLLNKDASHLLAFSKKIIQEIIERLELDIILNVETKFIRHSTENIQVLRDQFKYTGPYTKMESQIARALQVIAIRTHLPFVPGPRASILNLIFHLGQETRLFLDALINYHANDRSLHEEL